MTRTRSGVIPSSGGGGGAVDVTDRDARLLGRVKILNPAGVVIDPTLIRALTAADVVTLAAIAQLPAALVGGRLDMNLGAWLGSAAPTVGQKVMASSLPVVIASDQSNLPIRALTAADVVTVANPGGASPYASIYGFTLIDTVGVAAANRFISLFNPAGSGVVLKLLQVIVETYSIAASITRNSLRLTRVTTATVGTLQAAATVCKWDPSIGNALAEVRTANPTVTLAAEVSGFGANASMTVAGSTAVSRRTFDPDPNRTRGEFLLPEGHGVTLHQTIAGDTDQTHDLTVIWAEE